jgi:enamine deaminase RidA (YjgF/YER057c/UK114 family)|tara:strand:- start:92430 stop:92903 length:474 start_codon:yes stop_codon:yes gene_type:complete
MISTQEIYNRLEKKGLRLPKVAAPAANYVPYVISAGQVYISGQLPFLDGVQSHIGRLGDTLSDEDGIIAAQNCALNIFAQLDQAIAQDWSRVKRCVKLGGFVNSTAQFTAQPAIINGASNLIGDVLGEIGQHARFAVSACSLPFGASVEIDGLFEIS